MVCHSLLIELGEELVLVETGLGTDNIANPSRLGLMFRLFANPSLDPSETAVRQIEKLGFKASDVRHILITHLDIDHAGGLADFPDARIHIFEDEFRAAMRPVGFKERHRYNSSFWAHGPYWRCYSPQGEPWFGFDSVRQLEGLPPEILIIPMTGHTRGHSAIAVQGPRGWLLHAGDAYFHKDEMRPAGGRCSPGLDIFQTLIQINEPARKKNQARLRKLALDKAGEVRIFCAHDPDEYMSLAQPTEHSPSDGSSGVKMPVQPSSQGQTAMPKPKPDQKDQDLLEDWKKLNSDPPHIGDLKKHPQKGASGDKKPAN